MLNLVFNMGSHKLSGFVNFLAAMKDGTGRKAKAQLLDSAAITKSRNASQDLPCKSNSGIWQ